jgi:hypothetical protein
MLPFGILSLTPVLQLAVTAVVSRLQDKEKGPDDVRAAYAALLAAMCRAGASFLWTAAGYYAEEALKLAVAGLTDDTVTVSGNANPTP